MQHLIQHLDQQKLKLKILLTKLKMMKKETVKYLTKMLDVKIHHF